MAASALSTIISLWPPNISLPQTLHPCSAPKAALNVWFMTLNRLPYLGSYFVSPCSSSPSSCLDTLTMVRRRGSCCRGGSRGGRERSQPAPPPAIPLASVSPPSDNGKPFPHNSFQTTHFKFQSRLNKPVLSASVTVIFAEEEARPSVSVHTSATQSQDESEQQGEDVGIVFNCGDLQAEGSVPDVFKPPDGNLQEVLASVHLASGSDDIRRLAALPGGSGIDAEDTVDDSWMGNPCPVEEEAQDHETIA